MNATETDSREVLELHPTKRLSVVVHDAHFIGGEAFNQRWSFALDIYQLCRSPNDLLELLEGCAPGPSLRPKLVQLTDQALIYLLPPDNGLYWSDERQCYRHKFSFNVSTGRSNTVEQKVYNIHIMGTSQSATAEALLQLVRFPTKQMLTIELGMRSDIITPIRMQQILCECGGSFREYLFNSEALSSDECYRLARCASKLVFYECIFLDSGAAFMRGLQDRDTPLSVAFLGRDPPFPKLVSFFRGAELCELEFREGFLLSEHDCEALADARIERLTLDRCRLKDHGEALFTAIAAGRGPFHLRLSHWEDSRQQDEWLISAFCSEHCRLESINLIGSEELPSLSSWQAVLEAILLRNNSLSSFELDSIHLTDEHWDIFLNALKRTKTIHRLSFRNMTNAGIPQNKLKTLARTSRLADIVQRNRSMEEIQIKGVSPFDPMLWETRIVPSVLDNRYRSRFRKLQRDPNAAPLLAHALARPELQKGTLVLYLYTLGIEREPMDSVMKQKTNKASLASRVDGCCEKSEAFDVFYSVFQ